MKNKVLVIICLIIIIVASIITNIYILSNKEETENTENNGIKTVENKELLEDTKIENLDLTNISIITRDNISTYNAKITNNTSNEIIIDKLYVIFYENEIENKILASSNLKLEPNTNKTINIISETDLTKITKIEYVIE